MGLSINISAIADRDLPTILEHCGLSKKMEAGELTCESCSQTLTFENIGGLLVHGKSFLVYCDAPECIAEAPKGKE